MWHRVMSSVFDPEPQSRYLDRFGWLLLLTYLTIAGHMLVDFAMVLTTTGEEIGGTLAQLAATGMLILALPACGVSRRWRRAITFFALVGLVARLLLLVMVISGQTLQRESVPPWLSLILMILTFCFVTYRLSQHRQIRGATLLGSITAYLLIPIVFYFLFMVVDAIAPTPFFGRPAAGQEFMFFSLTTVTTLGYGDPKPVTHLGQLLATSEALVGQLYLVVVVALIVGLMASRWSDRR